MGNTSRTQECLNVLKTELSVDQFCLSVQWRLAYNVCVMVGGLVMVILMFQTLDYEKNSLFIFQEVPVKKCYYAKTFYVLKCVLSSNF